MNPKGDIARWLKYVHVNRLETADNILEFSFNKKRVRILSKAETVEANKKGVVYWMSRDMRVHDNWSLLFAQKLALKNKLPLHVIFCLLPNFLNATSRHFKFMLKGLQEMQNDWKELNIDFHLCTGEVHNVLPKIVKENDLGAVVCDFSPLRLAKEWVDKLVKELPSDVAVVQVDAHNIVPCWFASDKQEYAARTFRGKVCGKLDVFLTAFPPVVNHKYSATLKIDDISIEQALSEVKDDESCDTSWAAPGYEAGMSMLYHFCDKRLKIFATKRNDPTQNALSNLSPWLHFGQISAQRCVLEVSTYQSKYSDSVKAYREEVIVRRELSDNFCFYNPFYDSIKGAPAWAQETLARHSKDKREYVYTQNELEKSKTHDPLWNSAQIELVKTGKMHGFMRMYWAKKILEWTESPEEALRIGIYLNDYYSMDGRDPNGYVGVMWSVCGVHDQGWAERNVFGKIRYMNFAGCKRKFDINAYIARWGGQTHHSIPKKKLKLG